MHVAKEAVPVKLSVPGATARQLEGFGEASQYGGIAAEYFSMAEGTDLAPLLQGLAHDSCHSPHWGYIVSGQVVVTYDDRPEETCAGGDLFYWPPGHSLRVTDDAELVLFSPHQEHAAVIDHIAGVIEGMPA